MLWAFRALTSATACSGRSPKALSFSMTCANTWSIFRSESIERFAQLLALDELLDYAPNLRALMEQNPIIAKNITSPDGHIYALPQLNTTEGNLIGLRVQKS